MAQEDPDFCLALDEKAQQLQRRFCASCGLRDFKPSSLCSNACDSCKRGICDGCWPFAAAATTGLPERAAAELGLVQLCLGCFQRIRFTIMDRNAGLRSLMRKGTKKWAKYDALGSSMHEDLKNRDIAYVDKCDVCNLPVSPEAGYDDDHDDEEKKEDETGRSMRHAKPPRGEACWNSCGRVVCNNLRCRPKCNTCGEHAETCSFCMTDVNRLDVTEKERLDDLRDSLPDHGILGNSVCARCMKCIEVDVATCQGCLDINRATEMRKCESKSCTTNGSWCAQNCTVSCGKCAQVRCLECMMPPSLVNDSRVREAHGLADDGFNLCWDCFLAQPVMPMLAPVADAYKCESCTYVGLCCDRRVCLEGACLVDRKRPADKAACVKCMVTCARCDTIAVCSDVVYDIRTTPTSPIITCCRCR